MKRKTIMKINQKTSLFILIIILLVVFGIFLYFLMMPRDYSKSYYVDNYNVLEKYSTKFHSYLFTIKSEKEVYQYSLKSKEYKARKLLKKIKIKNGCIKVESNKISSFSICQKDGENYFYNYNDINNSEILEKRNKISTYKSLEEKLLVWNYNEFDTFNTKSNNIKLFDQDYYSLDLVYTYKNYLIVADYNSKYSFNQLNVINTNNNKNKAIKLSQKVSVNSYILGMYKKDLYLYDMNKKKEYKINIFNGNVDEVEYKVLNNNSWEKVSKYKLDTKEVAFINESDYYFFIDNDKLYYNMINNSLIVSVLKVNKIIKQTSDKVYYLVDNCLYRYVINGSQDKLACYDEWRFNNKNIYVFD